MLTRHSSDSTVDLNEHVITDKWLETLLHEYYSKGDLYPESKVTVSSFKVTNASDSSESVLSDIIALSIDAKVNEEKKSHDFVVKLLPLDPFSRYFVKEAEFDLREIEFYNKVVPELEDFQRQKLKSSASFKLPVPKCYLAKYVPMDSLDNLPSTPNEINESIIILENLKKNGYTNVSFSTGLSLKQAELAFEAISKIHALSLALKIQDDVPLNQKYKFLFQTDKASTSYQQLMERGLPQLIHFLQKTPGMKEIVDCLNDLRPMLRYLTQTLLSPKEPMSLITHTDFWSNNLLFKDNECKILDWQMVTYSRPTNDLALLVISSLPATVRRQHTMDLMDLYWKNFIENCKKLGLDIENKLRYTREDFFEDYKNSQLLALLLCIGSIDVALKDPHIEERLIAVLNDLHQDGILSPDFVKQF